MDQLARILLHVDTMNAYGLAAGFGLDFDPAVPCQAARTGISDTLWGGRDRNKAPRANRLKGEMEQCVARAILMVNSTTSRLRTGRTPGIPRHTGHVRVLGPGPEDRRATAKDLAPGEKMGMNLESDNRFVFHVRLPLQQCEMGGAPAGRIGAVAEPSRDAAGEYFLCQPCQRVYI